MNAGTKRDRREALQAIRDMIKAAPESLEGSVSCPSCGAARLKFVIEHGELGARCIEEDCGFSYSWEAGRW